MSEKQTKKHSAILKAILQLQKAENLINKGLYFSFININQELIDARFSNGECFAISPKGLLSLLNNNIMLSGNAY